MGCIYKFTINAGVSDDTGTVHSAAVVCLDEVHIKPDHLRAFLSTYKSDQAYAEGKKPILVKEIGGNFKIPFEDASFLNMGVNQAFLAAMAVVSRLEGLYGQGNVSYSF